MRIKGVEEFKEFSLLPCVVNKDPVLVVFSYLKLIHQDIRSFAIEVVEAFIYVRVRLYYLAVRGEREEKLQLPVKVAIFGRCLGSIRLSLD